MLLRLDLRRSRSTLNAPGSTASCAGGSAGTAGAGWRRRPQAIASGYRHVAPGGSSGAW